MFALAFFISLLVRSLPSLLLPSSSFHVCLLSPLFFFSTSQLLTPSPRVRQFLSVPYLHSHKHTFHFPAIVLSEYFPISHLPLLLPPCPFSFFFFHQLLSVQISSYPSHTQGYFIARYSQWYHLDGALPPEDDEKTTNNTRKTTTAVEQTSKMEPSAPTFILWKERRKKGTQYTPEPRWGQLSHVGWWPAQAMAPPCNQYSRE